MHQRDLPGKIAAHIPIAQGNTNSPNADAIVNALPADISVFDNVSKDEWPLRLASAGCRARNINVDERSPLGSHSGSPRICGENRWGHDEGTAGCRKWHSCICLPSWCPCSIEPRVPFGFGAPNVASIEKTSRWNPSSKTGESR